MSHKSSGLWCDLCGKPILSGHWWHIGIGDKPGHCHEDCKQEYQRKQVQFQGGAERIYESKEQDTLNCSSEEK